MTTIAIGSEDYKRVVRQSVDIEVDQSTMQSIMDRTSIALLERSGSSFASISDIEDAVLDAFVRVLLSDKIDMILAIRDLVGFDPEDPGSLNSEYARGALELLVAMTPGLHMIWSNRTGSFDPISKIVLGTTV